MTQISDVVVLLPGISGSALSKDGREIWGTSTGALWRAVVSGGETIRELSLPAPDDLTLDDLGDGIQATRIIPDLHLVPGLWKIDGYSATSAALVSGLGLRPGENFFEFPYDWRRANQVSAHRLARDAHRWLATWRERSGRPDAKLVLIGHSMGGLVARYFLEAMEGWRQTRALITFGTPFRGSLNALGFLANGFSKSIGPFEFDFAATLRSFSSVYQLLPTYPCLDPGDGTLRRVAEADDIPNLDVARAREAREFHADIERLQAANAATGAYTEGSYRMSPIVGVDQPTFQSGRVTAARRVELLRTHEGRELGGDGTVPRVSAVPLELSDAGREVFVSEAHGSLQNAEAVLSHVRGVLSGTEIDLALFRRRFEVTLGLDVDDAYEAHSFAELRARAFGGQPRLLARIFEAGTGRQVDAFELRPSADGMYRGSFEPAPGLYRTTVSGLDDPTVRPVTDSFAVLDGGRAAACPVNWPLLGAATPATSGPSGQQIEREIEEDAALEWAMAPIRRARESDAEGFSPIVVLPVGGAGRDREGAPGSPLGGGLRGGVWEEWRRTDRDRSGGWSRYGINMVAANREHWGNPLLKTWATGENYREEHPLEQWSFGAHRLIRAEPELDAPDEGTTASRHPIIEPTGPAGPGLSAHRYTDRLIRAEPELDAPDEGTTASRHPIIEPTGPAGPGRVLGLRVDLLGRFPPVTEPSEVVSFVGLPSDWEALEVAVELQSAEMDFAAGANRGRIVVRRNAPSQGCELTGTVRPEAQSRGAVSVLALFTHEGRFCGYGRRVIPLDRGQGELHSGSLSGPSMQVEDAGATSPATTAQVFPAAAAPLPVRAAAEPFAPQPTALREHALPASTTMAGDAEGGVLVDKGAPAADLTVLIFHVGDRAGCYRWWLDVKEGFPELPDKLDGTTELGEDSAEFARALLAKCPHLRPGDHMDEINGVGERLFEKAPEVFKKVYWQLRDRRGAGFSIQFVSEDPYVPWELMRPCGDGEGRLARVLVLDHPVARWIATLRGRFTNRLADPAGRIATIAPRYPGEGDRRLPWAEAESRRLCSSYNARPVAGRTAEVKGLLRHGLPDGSVAILHFAGHGSFSTQDADSSELRLEDGALTPSAVRVSEVALGAKDRTVVVLNACEAGVTGAVLGSIGGWAEAFTKRRFSGVLAPLWSVRDEHATKFVFDVIEAVWVHGEPVGEALRRVREEHMHVSSTPFAYVFYGDANASFARR